MIVGSRKDTANGPVQPQPLVEKQPRSAHELAHEYVEDFLGLLNEGWAPDLETFLESVPERLREEVFEQLDCALANRGPEATDPHLAPKLAVVVEPEQPTPPRAARVTPRPAVGPASTPRASDNGSSSPEDPTGGPGTAPAPQEQRAAFRLPVRIPVHPDLWVKVLGLLVPGDLRFQFVGELVAERRESRDRGDASFERNWQSFTRLLVGIAQYAPLYAPSQSVLEPPARARHAAQWGWYAWRAFGPMLALGVVLGSVWPFLAAVVLLATTFTGLILASTPPLHESQVRLINGALGGMIVTLGLTLFLGLFCALWIGLGSLLGWTWLSATVVRLLAWVAIAFTTGICASGWTPMPWAPTRLVRV